LEENHLTEKCFVMKSREASLQELITVHSNQYVQDFFSLKGQFNPQENNKKLSEGILEDDSILHDESTDIRVNQYTLKAARLSAGGVIKMCEKVVEGQLENGFAIVRPPGHHARPAEPMGFCFFNNVAVAARVIQNRYKHINRVLIVDFDIHHGNGTQDIFEDDPSVLYISLHRMEGDYFPGTGHVEEVGTGAGAGYTVNIPLPPKGAKMGPLATINDVDYLTVFNHVIMPISLEFAPDLVLVSAGFDAAKGDLLGKRMALSPTGFAHMISIMKTWAGGRIVLALEGGYNTDVTAQCATACLKVLLGEDPPVLPGKVASPATYQAIKQVVHHHHKYWKSLQIFAETFMSGSRGNNYHNEAPTISPVSPKEEKPAIDWTIKPETKTYVIDANGGGDFTTINEALYEAVKLSPTYSEFQQHKPPHRGKIVVQIHPGTYKTKLTLDNTLTHRDIEIVGVGERDKIVIEYNGAFARINGAHTVSIKGVTFRSTDDFTKPQPSLEETTFRFTNGAVDVEISDCVFQGVSLVIEANCRVQISDSIISFASKRAISVQGQAHAILNKNHITNNGIGVLVYMGGTLNATDNSIFSNAEYGILGYNPKGVIEGNSIYMNGLSGIQLLQGSIRIANNKIYNQVQAGIVINNNCTATIENNLIYNNAYSGIESGMNSRPIIKNNEIYNGRQSGILIVTKASGLIEGNKIYGNGFAGVEVREGNPTIKANQIYNQKQAGVGIHGGQSLSVIDGNDIFANEYANIEVKLYGNPTVTNNKIHNGKQHGVLVFEYGRGKFENNDIYENNFDGLISQSGGEPTAISNKIHNNGKSGINLGAEGKGQYESNDIFENKENGIRIIGTSGARFEKNNIHDHQDATHGYGMKLFQID
jgi:histone deacetylase 6